MVDWPATCPTCYSKYPDIHGVLFSPGCAAGRPCEDLWHRGKDYDPNKLNLTEQDRAWLARLYVRP